MKVPMPYRAFGATIEVVVSVEVPEKWFVGPIKVLPCKTYASDNLMHVDTPEVVHNLGSAVTASSI
jgi:hypothetical protein